jgi:hypothetical protein
MFVNPCLKGTYKRLQLTDEKPLILSESPAVFQLYAGQDNKLTVSRWHPSRLIVKQGKSDPAFFVSAGTGRLTVLAPFNVDERETMADRILKAEDKAFTMGNRTVKIEAGNFLWSVTGKKVDPAYTDKKVEDGTIHQWEVALEDLAQAIIDLAEYNEPDSLQELAESVIDKRDRTNTTRKVQSAF